MSEDRGFVFMSVAEHSRLLRQRAVARSRVGAGKNGGSPYFTEYAGKLVITVPSELLGSDAVTETLPNAAMQWVRDRFERRGWVLPPDLAA